MSPPSPKGHLIRGAAWSVGARTVIKGLGFLNTVIMARILMPEDYGLVAMATIVVGLIQAFLDFGPTTALLRKEHVTTDDIDSAWTLRLLQGFVAATLVGLTPLLAVPYFEEPRLGPILWVFSGCMVLSTLSTLAPALAQKSFDFALAFKLETGAKVTSVLTTLAAGVWLGDYRALIIGIVSGYVAPIVLTRLFHPHRHRFNLSKVAEIWGLTKWLLMANVGGFVLRKGDELAAAKLGTTAQYGNYNVGADLGALPVAEVGPAMLRALLPVLSTIQSDIQRTNDAIVKTMSALGTLIWPIGLGVYATAHDITAIVLGANWQGAAPYVATYGVIAVLQTLASPLRTLLTLREQTRVQSRLVWLEFGLFAALAALLVPRHGLIGLAWARLLASAINLAQMALAAQRLCALSVQRTAAQVLRPLAGALLMAMAVTQVQMALGQWGGPAVSLMASALTGAFLYASWCLLTWQLSGRPEGLESTVVDKLKSLQRTH